MTPILVLGIGNILLKDEGVGVHVVEAMAGQAAPPQDVEFVDGGTQGLALLGYVWGRKLIVILEAGFGSVQHFNRIFRRHQDMSPGEWRQRVRAATPGERAGRKQDSPAMAGPE